MLSVAPVQAAKPSLSPKMAANNSFNQFQPAPQQQTISPKAGSFRATADYQVPTNVSDDDNGFMQGRVDMRARDVGGLQGVAKMSA